MPEPAERGSTHTGTRAPTAADASDPFGDAAVDAPGPWHSPCRYWFWHSIPDQAQIEDQFERIARAGFGSFQIQVGVQALKAEVPARVRP